MSSIAVKVGKTSKLLFNSHVKAHRALTLDEAVHIYDRDNDCHILIIENISSEEEDNASELITKYKDKSADNLVFFYAPDNDDITTGVADELSYDIFITADALYKAIAEKTGSNVSPFIKDKVITSESDSELSADIKDIDENTESEIGADIALTIKDVEAQEEMQKQEENNTDTNDDNDENDNVYEGDNSENTINIEDIDEPKVNIKKAGDEAVGKDKIVSNADIFGDLSEDNNYDNYDEDNSYTDNTTDTEDESNYDLSSENSDNDELISKLRRALSDSKYEYSILLKDMQDAHSRIGELEKLVKALKDEKELLTSTYNELVQSDEILEDPIPLSEYQAIKEDLEAKTAKIVELESNIEGLKSKLDEEKETVSKNIINIAELTSNINSLEKELETINSSIESGEIHKDVREEYESKISEMEEEKKVIDAECDQLSAKHKQDIATIELLTANLTLETQYRYTSIDLFKSTFLKFKDKIDKLAEYRNEVDRLTADLELTTKDRDSLEASGKETSAELEAAKLDASQKDIKISELENVIGQKDTEIENKQSEIDSKQSEIDSLNENIKLKEADIQKKDTALKDKDTEISTINATHVTEIQKLNSEKETALQDKDTEISTINATHAAEIQKLNSEKDAAVQQVQDEMQSAIDAAHKEKEDALAESGQKIEELKNTISEKDSKIESNEKTIKQKEYEISIQLATIEQRDNELELIKEELEDKKASLKKTEEKFEKSEQRLKDMLEKLRGQSGVDISADALTNDNSEEVEKLNDEIATLNNQISGLNEEIATLKAKLEVADSQNSAYKDEIDELKQSQPNTEEVDTSGLESKIESLTNTNKSLQEKLSAVQRDATLAATENSRLTGVISELENERDRYKNLANSSRQTIQTVGKNVVPAISYNGGASIISVFGSGSFGITSVAISLAYKLSATTRVAYLDLDLMSPSADAWFSKSPAVSGFPGVLGTKIQDTSFGVLFERGISVLASNMNGAMIQAERTKGGGIDFMSGAYYRPDEYKIAGADYGTLLNILSEKYNYIIVDLGKIGSSEIQDSMISEFTAVSDNSIIVTTDDKFGIRNTRNKLINCKVNQSRASWLINSSLTGTIDDKVKSLMGNIPYGILIEDTAIRGRREKLFKNRLNSDKFNAFINNAVFGRR